MKTLQNEAEHRRFIEILVGEGVTSFLEIGSKFGGSLRAVAQALPVGSRIVSVDLPAGTKAWPESKITLPDTINDLKRRGYDAHLIWGDSTDPNVIKQVQALGPFDAVFIDGNHTLPFVTKDWLNYGSISRIVAFHDIGWWRPAGSGHFPIDAPQLWAELRQKYRHEEIRQEERDNGIGVLWRD